MNDYSFRTHQKCSIQFSIFLMLLIFYGQFSMAQTPWSGQYGNEWLTGKYQQKWLRIPIREVGIYRITLPADFQNKPSQLHLYRRGIEVHLLRVTNTEIEFYGVGNDGQSDALLYRDAANMPDTSARINKHYSLFSDESSYFLTYSETPGLRAQTVIKTLANIPAEAFHVKEVIRRFTDQYSYTTYYTATSVYLAPSFWIAGKGMTSVKYGNHSRGNYSGLFGDFATDFVVSHLIATSSMQPSVELLLHGRNISESNDLTVKAGKDSSNLRDLTGSNHIVFQGLDAVKKTLPLTSSLNQSLSDLPGSGYFRVKAISNRIGTRMMLKTNSVDSIPDYSSTAMFALAYAKLRYPQAFTMNGQGTVSFEIPPSTDSVSRVEFQDIVTSVPVYDITDPDHPVILIGIVVNSKLNVMVPRVSGKSKRLFVQTNNVSDVTNKAVVTSFTSISPESHDYLMISTEKLRPAAEEYKAYRGSALGGYIKPLLLDIREVYNQFNFGEISPVAIRRFADYMLSGGIRDAHNLLLIGNSIMKGDSIHLNKELPDQVPTIGYPGSDVLLVAGLAGAHYDLPAIPVGRIPTDSIECVRNYLQKVIQYEQDTTDRNWRRNVLHMTGGKLGEVDWFKSILASQASKVQNNPFLGNLIVKVKQNPDFSETNPEYANVSSEVNNGLGFISFLGHGTPENIEFSMGYASDPNRGYQNTKKYSIMSFASCAVANVFKSRHDILARNWLFTKDRGAVAIVALSYYGWASVETAQLPFLYGNIFSSPEETRKTLGNILSDVGAELNTPANRSNYPYYISNGIHQRMLLGDPALLILRNSQKCKPVASVTDSLQSGSASHKQAQNFLITSAVVSSGAQAKYNAGTEVTLKDGFASVSGSDFVAYVSPCSGLDSSNARKSAEPELAQVENPDMEAEEIYLYPNPSNGVFDVQASKIASGSIQIVDMNGRTLLTRGFQGKRGLEVDIRRESPGGYILKIVSGNKVFSKSFVKLE